MQPRIFALTILAACAPLDAAAHGALAVGMPPDTAKGGVAIGISFDYDNRDDAKARALQECRAYLDAPPETLELCKVVDVFAKPECLVIARDTAPGMRGLGWSVGGRTAATELALARCAESAGDERKGACQVTDVRCDGER